MIFRLDRFFFDEKDVFVFLFGLFLLAASVLDISIFPFRMGSLLVLFLYLVLTRSIKNSQAHQGYLVITLIGFILSLTLSPYGVGIFLLLTTLLYMKWGRG